MTDTNTNRKLRVGVIGCGGISNSHLQQGLSKFEDIELAAFCDVIPERAEKHAAKYGGKAYDDASKMLENTRLDAAFIFIPPYAHTGPERACLAAGVPFEVEKPLGLNSDEMRKMAAEVEASGLITSAGFMTRYRKSINQVRELLQSDPAILLDGAWVGGPPLVKEGDYFANNPIGLWWPIKERSGGQFVEQVIHTVDLARYLVGEAAEVYAFAAKGFNKKLPNLIPQYDLEDAMVVSIRFESGAVGNIMSACCNGAHGGIFLNLWAAHHTVHLTGWGHDAKIYTQGEKEPATIQSEEEIFGVEDRAFLDAVRTGDRSRIKCTYADGVKTTQLALAANESVATGKPVKI
ncbi:MAG TPA: Gfo/Idh/MocA family oxidoreductase [Chthonomonadaceae bacterium]|nr:Gfo/Idh/MocA family oxidoreductase [Chthonomonadaceae bacterium]